MTYDVAAVAIRRALVQFPGLTWRGLPIGRRHIAFTVSDWGEVLTAMAYLESLQRSNLPKQIVQSSYVWKHRAQRFGEVRGMANYVSLSLIHI